MAGFSIQSQWSSNPAADLFKNKLSKQQGRMQYRARAFPRGSHRRCIGCICLRGGPALAPQRADLDAATPRQSRRIASSAAVHSRRTRAADSRRHQCNIYKLKRGRSPGSRQRREVAMASRWRAAVRYLDSPPPLMKPTLLHSLKIAQKYLWSGISKDENRTVVIF